MNENPNSSLRGATPQPGLPVQEPYCEPLEPLRAGTGPFRPNAAALVLRNSDAGPEVLLGERLDTPNAWQWPQGGVDDGETPKECAVRELAEEIGVARPTILYQFPFVLRYRFPLSMKKRFKNWIGQEQYYFLMTLRPDDQPNLHRAETPEFRELKWVPLDRALDAPVWFKAPVYQAAMNHAIEVVPTLRF